MVEPADYRALVWSNGGARQSRFDRQGYRQRRPLCSFRPGDVTILQPLPPATNHPPLVSIVAPDFQTRKKLPVVAVGEKERKPAGSWSSIVGQTRSSNEPSARQAEAEGGTIWTGACAREGWHTDGCRSWPSRRLSRLRPPMNGASRASKLTMVAGCSRRNPRSRREGRQPARFRARSRASAQPSSSVPRRRQHHRS
jgi:hypothetical protein